MRAMSLYFALVGAFTVAVATIDVIHWGYRVVGFLAVAGFYVIGILIQRWRREDSEHRAWQAGYHVGRVVR